MDFEKMLSSADRHLELAEGSADEFMREYPYITNCQSEIKGDTPDTAECAFQVWNRHPIRDTPEQLILQIGDTLHALRVSLDYLAVHVVMKTLPSANEGKVAFPIFTDPSEFTGKQSRRIPGVSGDLLNAFKAVQPCFGTHRQRPEQHPLVILDGLEQPHKHRRLINATPAIHTFEWYVSSGNAADVTYLSGRLPTAPLGEYEKAEVARFRISTDADHKLKAKVEGKFTFFICFDRQGAGFGWPAISTLKQIREHIRQDVVPQFKNFI